MTTGDKHAKLCAALIALKAVSKARDAALLPYGPARSAALRQVENCLREDIELALETFSRETAGTR